MRVTGQTAEGTDANGYAVRAGGLYRGTAYAPNPAAAAGTTLPAEIDLSMTLDGALINKPYASSANAQTFATAAGGITTNTTTTVFAAQAAPNTSNAALLNPQLNNYMTSFQFHNSSSTATAFQITDGGNADAVLFAGYAAASMLDTIAINFPVPLKASAGGALHLITTTTGAALLANAQGYIAP